jgi:uncharacterized protein (DUF169 family)
MNYTELERQFTDGIGLERRPVAIAFCETAPAGIEKFSGSEPAGCGFWRLAAGGRIFYTEAADHHHCAIGSYTHNLPAPDKPLQETLELMAGIDYVRPEEVPGIARLPGTPVVILYAPLGRTPIPPDVVLFSGRPGRLMLLEEAALRAGVRIELPLLARPTCVAVPLAAGGSFVASSGCIGNRVYTGIGEDELYVALPGPDLKRVAAEVATIAKANATLAEYHQARLTTLRA